MNAATHVLVAGGGGFVLSNLVLRLLQHHTDARVTVFDRAPLDRAASEFLEPVRDRLDIVTGDVRNPAELDERLPLNQLTHIVHGATVTHMPEWERADPGWYLDVNLMGTARILEVARRAPRLSRILHMSSGAVYGDRQDDSPAECQPEEGPFAPPEMYAISKYASEMAVRRYSKLFGLDSCIVRCSDVYGHMERPTGARAGMSLPYKLMRAHAEGRPLRATAESRDGGGDFVSARDTARALESLLFAQLPHHRVFNIAYGKRVRLFDLLSAMEQAGYPVEIAEVPSDQAELALDPENAWARFNAYCIDRIAAAVNWRPSPLEQELAAYAGWVMENPDVRCPPA